MRPEIWVPGAFGVISLIALFAIALLVKAPNPQLIFLNRVTVALACACIAAIVPGTVNLSLNAGATIAIQAVGALAIFVLVYWRNPPVIPMSQTGAKAEETVPNTAQSKNDASEEINAWTKLVEVGDVNAAYSRASSDLRQGVSLLEFKASMESFRTKNGKIAHRAILGITSASQTSDNRKGIFKEFHNEIRFKNNKTATEFVRLRLEESEWRVCDYLVGPTKSAVKADTAR